MQSGNLVHNIPEECKSHLHHSQSLISCKEDEDNTSVFLNDNSDEQPLAQEINKFALAKYTVDEVCKDALHNNLLTHLWSLMAKFCILITKMSRTEQIQ
jgi:hypothetical protein